MIAAVSQHHTRLMPRFLSGGVMLLLETCLIFGWLRGLRVKFNFHCAYTVLEITLMGSIEIKAPCLMMQTTPNVRLTFLHMIACHITGVHCALFVIYLHDVFSLLMNAVDVLVLNYLQLPTRSAAMLPEISNKLGHMLHTIL